MSQYSVKFYEDFTQSDFYDSRLPDSVEESEIQNNMASRNQTINEVVGFGQY